MRLPRLKAIVGFFLAAILSAPAWAADTSAKSALPGTLNYVEGKVSMGDQTLDSKSIGSAELQPGQLLTTEDGKAEILLTPGVFLRVGANSSVKMVSPSITNTELGLEKGHAMVEVAEIHPENDIRITQGDTTTRLLKTGLYDFNMNQEELRVFDGKASVEESGKRFDVKGGRELSLDSNGSVKAQKFNKKSYEEDDLYRWSSLRSAYLAEANVDAAGLYANNGWGPWGPGWWGADWYWDPYFDSFTFIPGDGIFYSPFGWGFYSPWWVYQAPFYGYGYGGYGYGYGYRNGGGSYYHHFSSDVHNWGPGDHYVGGRNYANGVYRGPGSAGGGFHSGPRMMGGSRGFGGGGFHGGGGQSGGFQGGGFHGGVGFHGGGGFHGH
ncbi:MAG: FecR domain-containing protein [Terriglobales bacterium]